MCRWQGYVTVEQKCSGMDTGTCAGHAVWLRTGPSDGHEPSDVLSLSKRTLFPGDGSCMLICHLNGGQTVMVFEK